MPTSISAILVVVVFLMPGFIGSTVLAFVYPRSASNDARTVLTAITFSCFNHASLSWLIVLAWKRLWYENIIFLAFFSLFSLFAMPVLIALLFAKINDTDWGRRFRDRFGLMHPVPKSWDYFFRRRVACWILATMKDGRAVAGLYGKHSFASSFPADEDIYLERLCILSPEGQIIGVAPYSLGGIISMENISTLEFFDSLQSESSNLEGHHEQRRK